jgi:hypothetical protein
MEQYHNDFFNSKVKKYNKNLIADPGYDSSFIKNQLKNDNMIPIIKYNKRKCKNQGIIGSNRFDEKTFKLYKTRFFYRTNKWIIKIY